MEKESVLCVVSDFVYNELAFQRIKIPLVAEARRTGRSWLEVKRNSQRFSRTVPRGLKNACYTSYFYLAAGINYLP
jgi:hypothetical protein